MTANLCAHGFDSCLICAPEAFVKKARAEGFRAGQERMKERAAKACQDEWRRQRFEVEEQGDQGDESQACAARIAALAPEDE